MKTDAGQLRFRPTLLGSLAAGAVLLVLLGLGIWQLDRLGWKRGLIAALDDRANRPAISLPGKIDAAELEYARVRLSGTLLSEKELLSAPRNLGKRPGFYLFAPLRLEDGRTIVVNLGWLPERMRQRSERQGLLPAGPISLEAILLREGWRGSSWFQPGNDPGNNVWHYVDTAAMAGVTGIDAPVAGVYAVALPNQWPGEYPIARPPGVDIVNNHLEYAITWFSLAAILVVIYLVYHVKREPS